jgi:hypothetical protein
VARAKALGDRVAERHDPLLCERVVERQKEKSKRQKAKRKKSRKAGRRPMAQRLIAHWSFQMDAVHGVLSPIYPDKIPIPNFHLKNMLRI